MSGKPVDSDKLGFCVIMAGGRGTRFWPLSRTRRPKQLLPLGQGSSLLRETFERVRPLVGDDRDRYQRGPGRRHGRLITRVAA